MKHPGRRTLAVAFSLVALGSTPALADEIKVQSTTDTVDAGLVDGLLKPGYAVAQPGDTLSYTAVGTGKALDNARAGQADVVITHAPTLEKQFTDDGFSLEGPGRAIFYSDYVIVGPKSDPAGVKAAANHDAVAAFERIAAAGAAGTASFVSRGDNSGTNVQEQLMWALTGDGVPKRKASNAGTATNRSEPGTGTTYPAWYKKTNVGQAASLQKADACAPGDFPTGNCYTIVDRGTFNRLDASGTITKLAIVGENNDPTARGGKDLLINPFSAYIVNPAKVPGVNVAAAQRFLDYLTSPGFQTAVDTFPSATNPAFHGDAFPALSVDTPLPPTAQSGAKTPLGFTIQNRQPGAPGVQGIPVQLQASTDDGTTWTNAGAPVTATVAGHLAFSPKATRTTRYRVTTSRFQGTYWNAFSPYSQEVGTVTILTDKKKPTASKVALSPRRIVLRLDEAARTQVTIERRETKRVRKGGRTRTVVSYRRVKSVKGNVTKARTIKLTWKNALKAGVYRVTLKTTDTAKNTRTQHRRVTIKR